MIVPFPKEFVPEEQAVPYTLPLEDYDTIQSFSHNGFEVKYGLTAGFAGSIAIMAHKDKLIREYCPLDAYERFQSVPDAEKWLERSGGAGFFMLLRDEEVSNQTRIQRLVGYGWTADKSHPVIPGSETALEIRIGQAARGEGLAAGFGRIILAASRVVYGRQNFWLETWASNLPAVQAAYRMGFEKVQEIPQIRAVGLSDVADRRFLMALR